MNAMDEIKHKIKEGKYEFSKHALDQSIIRNISLDELEQALLGNSERIENYPNDKYGPSCLILGFTKQNRPLHIQCSSPKRTLIKIITLYEPAQTLWENFKIRKQN